MVQFMYNKVVDGAKHDLAVGQAYYVSFIGKKAYKKYKAELDEKLTINGYADCIVDC